MLQDSSPNYILQWVFSELSFALLSSHRLSQPGNWLICWRKCSLTVCLHSDNGRKGAVCVWCYSAVTSPQISRCFRLLSYQPLNYSFPLSDTAHNWHLPVPKGRPNKMWLCEIKCGDTGMHLWVEMNKASLQVNHTFHPKMSISMVFTRQFQCLYQWLA